MYSTQDVICIHIHLSGMLDLSRLDGSSFHTNLPVLQAAGCVCCSAGTSSSQQESERGFKCTACSTHFSMVTRSYQALKEREKRRRRETESDREGGKEKKHRAALCMQNREHRWTSHWQLYHTEWDYLCMICPVLKQKAVLVIMTLVKTCKLQFIHFSVC